MKPWLLLSAEFNRVLVISVDLELLMITNALLIWDALAFGVGRSSFCLGHSFKLEISLA